MDHTPGSSSKYMTAIYNYFCKKNDIFRLFESKKFMKICAKTHQIAPFKNNFSGNYAPEPPSKRMATPRVESPPPKKNNWPPLANPAYAHELLLGNLFENPPWQTVDCV